MNNDISTAITASPQIKMLNFPNDGHVTYFSADAVTQREASDGTMSKNPDLI